MARIRHPGNSFDTVLASMKGDNSLNVESMSPIKQESRWYCNMRHISHIAPITSTHHSTAWHSTERNTQ